MIDDADFARHYCLRTHGERLTRAVTRTDNEEEIVSRYRCRYRYPNSHARGFIAV